ncbi:MAG: hypothetical protein AB1714_28135 [Acidobacteriota bacterium]
MEACELAEEAIKRNPDDARGYSNQGVALTLLGTNERNHGRDADQSYGRAVTAHQKALDLEPDDPALLFRYGNGLRVYAEYKGNLGEDPSGLLKESASWIQRAIDKDPNWPNYFYVLGLCKNVLAGYQWEHGQDPRPALEEARAAYAAALKMKPEFWHVRPALWNVVALMAFADTLQGGDPAPVLRQVLTELQSTTQGSQIHRTAFMSLVATYAHISRNELVHDRNPSEFLEEGRRTLQSALTTQKDYYALHREGGHLETVAGRWAIKRGRPADRYFKAALGYLHKALELNANDRGTYASVAEVYRWNAEYDLGKGVSPERDIRDGIAAADKAISSNRRPWEALALSGTLELIRARAERNTGKRIESAKRAAEKLDRTLQNSVLLRHEYAPLLDEARRMEEVS